MTDIFPLTRMKMEVQDFYSGFEGEPEIILTRRDAKCEIVEMIRLWDGYFSDIVRQIPLGQNGEWEGIPLEYHLLTGWYAQNEWEDKNPVLFLSQLETIDPTNFQLKSNQAFEAMKLFVEMCTAQNQRLFLQEN